MFDITHYCYEIPELTDNEKQLPLSKFYLNYPLIKPNPLQQLLLDSGPMRVEHAIPVENWLDLLDIWKYPHNIYGYTMMPDGSGYYIEYSVTPPTWKREWRRWFGKFYNHYSRSTIKSEGNLRYKIWNPLDHWDHKFVNGEDDTNGVWSLEKLDMLEGGDPRQGIGAVSHTINLRDYGLTKEKEEALHKAGCTVSACWEEFEGPGHHLVLRFSRPCPTGGRENINCEWIGYYAENGNIIRDESTPVSEEYLRNVLLHNTVERAHLLQVLPDLYEEYHLKDIEAD